MRNTLPIFLIVALVTSAYGQGQSAIVMQWQLKAGEVLTYRTSMEQIDSATNVKLTFEFDRLLSTIRDTSTRSLPVDFFDEFQKAARQVSYETHLRKRTAGSIDIDMVTAVEKSTRTSKPSRQDTVAERMSRFLEGMDGTVALRGRITEEGTIESFWVKNDQKNLLALLFELPGRPVAVGESWSLDLNFIAMDETFICDSSFRRNRVTLSQIREKESDTIAVLEYDIEEYASGILSNPLFGKNNGTIPSKMSVSFRGVAEFSIDKGRWISYEGTMATTITGIMSGSQMQRFALVPE